MTIPVPVSSCGYDSDHTAVFLRLMRTIFRSLTGRLTRCYVSEDACVSRLCQMVYLDQGAMFGTYQGGLTSTLSLLD
jgi:hypothetical protein